MPARKMRTAMKRLMQRCRWMLVLGLWMERISENVRMQMNRQINERDRPIQVISCNSNLSCWGEREREEGDVAGNRNRLESRLSCLNHVYHRVVLTSIS